MLPALSVGEGQPHYSDGDESDGDQAGQCGRLTEDNHARNRRANSAVPVHAAYPVPTGRSRSAQASNTMLMTKPHEERERGSELDQP
jgi:hypothetical protein